MIVVYIFAFLGAVLFVSIVGSYLTDKFETWYRRITQPHIVYLATFNKGQGTVAVFRTQKEAVKWCRDHGEHDTYYWSTEL